MTNHLSNTTATIHTIPNIVFRTSTHHSLNTGTLDKLKLVVLYSYFNLEELQIVVSEHLSCADTSILLYWAPLHRAVKILE